MSTRLTCQPTPLSITDRWTPLVRPVSLVLHRTWVLTLPLAILGLPGHRPWPPVCRGSHPSCWLPHGSRHPSFPFYSVLLSLPFSLPIPTTTRTCALRPRRSANRTLAACRRPHLVAGGPSRRPPSRVPMTFRRGRMPLDQADATKTSTSPRCTSATVRRRPLLARAPPAMGTRAGRSSLARPSSLGAKPTLPWASVPRIRSLTSV
jgi:hypothetical protein